MFRLGDSAGGLQAAGVVEFPDGRWPAVEAKLGGAEAIDSAADSLLRLRRRVGPPASTSWLRSWWSPRSATATPVPTV